MQSLHAQKRVLLLSTVHASTDPRIVGKISMSLSPYYEVHCALTVGEGGRFKNQEIAKNQVYTVTFPFFRHIWQRFLWVHPRALWVFLKTRPHIVHIFVAELLPLAFVFSWLGAEVICEVQENIYKKIPTKTYNRGRFYQLLFRFFDQQARKKFKFIFTEDGYLKEYQPLAKPYAIVRNFAASQWLSWPMPAPDLVQPTFFYAGVISYERAFDTLLKALCIVKEKYANVRLRLFGHLRISFSTLEASPDYQKVKENLIFHGYCTQIDAFGYAKDTLAGIALLKPVGDYGDSYPTKLFDYMALGLPVITSDLPLLRAVVEPHRCGFCVSPYDADALATWMIWAIEHPNELKTMGENGRKAVIENYNWEKEATKLLDLYQTK